jgi:hypothetical protein
MGIEYVKNDSDEFVCQHKGCHFTTKQQNTMCYHMKRHNGDYKFTCKEAGCNNMGFIQKSAYLHHMAAKHPLLKEISLNADEKIKNPYTDKVYTCAVCNHTCRTKANILVHYGRLHSEGWIPSYNKDSPDCPSCKKSFNSIASYLYHCTGCIPANKAHREIISRMIESV